MKTMRIIIDGPDVTVDVDGVKGKKCLDITRFIEEMAGVGKVEIRHKAEMKYIEVPTELKVG